MNFDTVFITESTVVQTLWGTNRVFEGCSFLKLKLTVGSMRNRNSFVSRKCGGKNLCVYSATISIFNKSGFCRRWHILQRNENKKREKTASCDPT